MGAASVKSQNSSLEVCLSSTLARTSGTETNLSKTNNKGHLGLEREASALKVLDLGLSRVLAPGADREGRWETGLVLEYTHKINSSDSYANTWGGGWKGIQCYFKPLS